MNRALTMVVAMTLLAISCTQARADDTLNPKTYKSPNGKYTLRVDPSSPSGEGAAKYSFEQTGKVLWGGERDYTLWEATVTNTGIIAGYTYNYGEHGWPRGQRREPSRMDVLILSRAGVVMQQDSHDRAHPKNIMTNPPSDYYPIALGLLTDGAGDWFAVRVSDEHDADDERWLPFRLSTGEQLAPVTPEQPKHGQYGFHRSVSCGIVPGTPLTLVHWYTWDTTEDRAHKDGARLALLDHAGKQVWALDLPDEYAGLGKDEHWSWYYDLIRPGIVQSGMGERTFWFHSYKLQAKIEYEITPDPAAPSEWTVVEKRRQENAGAPQPAPPAGGPIQDIAREPLGVIHLQTDSPGAAKSSLFNLRYMAIGADGTLAAVRGGSEPTLVLVDETGKVLSEHSLASLGEKRDPAVTAISGTRWMLYTSGLHGDGKAQAWTFDAANPQAPPVRLEQLNTGALRELEAFPDGGFVAITGADWSGAHNVTKFDAQGAAQWTTPGVIIQDVAVTTDGRVAVLTGIQDTISFYRADGTPDGDFDLATVLGRKPNYVSGIAPDRDGGLILFDFNGTPPVYRLTRDGKVAERATPKYADGRLADVTLGQVKASPVDGRLWACAADGLLRLGPEGVADRTLGDAAGAGRQLRHINAIAIAPDGGIYAVNGDDCSVHVFDKSGALQRILRPNATDFVARNATGSIAVQADGTVRYTPGSQFERGDGLVRFGPDGARAGKERPSLGEVSEECYGVPGTQRRWAVGYTSLALIGDDGQIARHIKRRPNDEWLGKLSNAAVAPDGSIAVIAGPDQMGTRGPAFVCVYSNSGEPVTSVAIPLDTIMTRIAFNGRTVAITDDNDVHLIPLAAGAPTRRFHLPATEGAEAYWYLYTSPSGDELWARQAGSANLVRFAFDP